MHKKIKLGVVGVGSHFNKNLLPVIQKNSQLGIAAIFTRSEERARELCAIYPDVEIFTDYNNFIESGLFDALYISSPVGLHYEQALKALHFKIHVLCEKKLTQTYMETSNLIDTAFVNNVVLFEGLMYQFHSQFKAVEKIMQETSEKLKSVTAKFCIPHLPLENIRYSKSLGGGALNDAGIYPASFFAKILGKTPDAKKMIVLSESGYDVDTTGVLIARYDDVLCIAEWGFGMSYTNSVNLKYETFEVDVPRAFSKPGNFHSHVIIRDCFGVEEVVEVGTDDHFEVMLNEFVININMKIINKYSLTSLFSAELLEVN